MGTRAKLSEKAYANAWNQFTQEKAKRLINENIKKRGGFKYHSAVKTLVMGNNDYHYDPDRKVSKKLMEATFKQFYQKVKAKGKIKQLYKKQEKVALTEELKNVYARKLQKFYTDKIKADTNTQSTSKKLSNRAGEVNITNIKDTYQGMSGLIKVHLAMKPVEAALASLKGLKVWLDTHIQLKDKDDKIHPFFTRSRPYELHKADQLDKVFSDMVSDVKIQLENKKLGPSGLRVDKILSMKVHYVKYVPMRAGKFIKLPANINNTKACINIKNEDNMCFFYSIYCVVKGIMNMDHPERMHHYNKYVKNHDGINWSGVEFPVTVGQGINQFEENNPNIAVNVYELFESKVSQQSCVKPLRITHNMQAPHHVNLLYIEQDDVSHYVVIKDLNRLCFQQYSKHGGKIRLCPYCMHNYTSLESWNNSACSKKQCFSKEENTVFEMPASGDVVSFNNEKEYDKQFLTPFAIMLDFEAFNKQIDMQVGDNTVRESVHEVNSYCLYLISQHKEFQRDPVLYRGPNCVEHLFETLQSIEQDVVTFIKTNQPMNLTPEEQASHDKATVCHICCNEKGKGFCSDYKDKDFKRWSKVRDHCHFTGKYRGPAHAGCNLCFHYRNLKVPVFCHNMKGYDSHFIISKADEFKCRKLSCIAQNSEKFLSFSFDRFEFKDSMAFMATSLDKLVQLNKSNNKPLEELFKHTAWGARKHITACTDLDYLTSKGVYPYKYMNSFERFNETQLPSKQDFYNDLANEAITPTAYKFAQDMWDRFDCKTMGDYHDLYLLTDVLLLADVFTVFRDMCMNNYGLDCFQYLTLSHYAWNAMLKKTKVELDLIDDMTMYNMVERGKRGGMVQASKRHVEANNPYMKEHDPSKETSYVEYVDANNLYGWAMSQALPHKEYMWWWLTEEEIRNYNEDDQYGYYIECDLIYPKELHDRHSDYPLAPERMCVTADMISEYSEDVYRRVYNLKDTQHVKDEKVDKLILNLHDKKKYVLHIRNLKFYLEQGMKLKQVHNVIRFKQSKWLKKWIDFNTEKRKKADNDFEKDLFKLMNNAVFGKTMEDVKNRMDFELVKCPKRFDKLTADPAFKCATQINDGLVGIERVKKVVKLNKPLQIGVGILDLAKLHMYDFYYNVLKTKYEENIQLCYTDTDSLVVHVKTEDIYEDMINMKEHFDLSGLDKSHKAYNTTNKKVVGKFSIEFEGKIIKQFCALKAKMYAFKLDEGKEKMTAKGCPKVTMKQQMNFEKYYNTLMEGNVEHINFKCIRHKNHKLFTLGVNKVGLTDFDNKRYYIGCNESRPYGHYKNA